MDRRWVGLLIIFLVVVAAIAVPSAGGRRIAGAARSVPVPAPPRAGDCLTAPETDTWLQGGPAPYRSAALGPCVGQVYGEVVAVTADRRQHHPATRTPGDGSELIDDPNEAPCLQTAARYIGLTVGADDNILIASYWEPLGPLSASPSGPTRRQLAAGQNWVACVVFVPDSSGRSVAYHGTLKDMFTLGTEPAAMAVCLDSADLSDAEITPCARSHRVEAFGATETARPGLTQQGLDASCRALVSRMTAMTDPSAGGQLQVRAATVHGETGAPVPGLGSPTDESGYAACVVVAPAKRALQRTLLALGNSPLPWSG